MRRTARQLHFRSYKDIPFFLRILLNDNALWAATLSLLEVHNPLRNPPRGWPFAKRETLLTECLSNYMRAILSMMSYPQSKALEETRHRTAELYLNGTCLVRSICCGSFQKVPFFLRHLWCALLK